MKQGLVRKWSSPVGITDVLILPVRVVSCTMVAQQSERPEPCANAFISKL
jgi:hypothetical protein